VNPPEQRQITEGQAGEQPPGIIKGTALEKWADKVIGEDPRAKTRVGLDPIEESRRALAWSVKGAALIEQGITKFSQWAKEMVRTYGPQIQPYLRDLYNRSQSVFKEQNAIQEQQAEKVLRNVPQQSGRIEQGVPAAEGAGRVPPGNLPPGETARREHAQAQAGQVPLTAAQQAATAAREVVNAGLDFGRWYSEWMPDRIRRIGQTVAGPARRFANQANQILSKAKGYEGELKEFTNPAQEEAGRLGEASRWMHELREVTPRAAIAHSVEAVEGNIPVPGFAERLVNLTKRANLKIGQMLEPVIEGFRASGLWQRNLTGFGYDLVRRGSGAVWEAWTQGLAAANRIPVADVRAFFRGWKAELDRSGEPNVARLEQINQDFNRRMPKAITHVLVDSVVGSHWEPVIHANVFNYLQAAAKRAATVRAFREEFPQGQFGHTFGEVMADIPGQYKSSFEGLVRALNGHPTDSYDFASRIGLAPDQPIGAAFRTLNQTLGNFMARLVLTGQILTQLPETIIGATPAFLGYRNYMGALARFRELYPQMEINGQVNRVIYDNSFDPNSPIRSAWRIAGNTVSRTFAEQFLNEMQESTAAATATIVAEKVRAGALSEWEQTMLPQTLQAMGFTRAQAADMLANRAPELLTQFERRAAAWLTSGNKAIAEGSLAGASRLFNSVFRFQSYPMMKANQFGRTLKVAADSWREGNTPAEKMAGVRLLGRFMFGTTAQGALYVGLTSLLMNQLFGFKVSYEEAKDEPLQFLTESFGASMGGPLYMVMRGARTHGALGIGEQFARTFFPYQVISSLWDMTQGDGAYRDLDAGDKLGKFIEQRIPGSRLISSGLAMFGLGQENKKLQTSLRAFYRWRVDEMGFRREEAWLKRDPNQEFRVYMKQAVQALQKGDADAYMEALMKASGAPNAKPKSVAASLRARRVLRDTNGKKLSDEDMEKLRKRIGDEAVQRLVYYDVMLNAAADGVILPPEK